MHGKLKFLHMANFFSTSLASEASDIYQVYIVYINLLGITNITESKPKEDNTILRKIIQVWKGKYKCEEKKYKPRR